MTFDKAPRLKPWDEAAMNVRFAFVLSETRGLSDRLLSCLTRRLCRENRSIVGVVQTRPPAEGSHPCEMDVSLVPGGPVIALSQQLGPGSRGCRLDPAALEAAALWAERALSARTALFVLNKFGAHECAGRGFASAIARALELEVPVLTSVNSRNLPAFNAFSEGVAEQLPCTGRALDIWVAKALAQ